MECESTSRVVDSSEGYHLNTYLFDLLKQTDLNEYLESNTVFLENIVVFRKACFNNNNEL